MRLQSGGTSLPWIAQYIIAYMLQTTYSRTITLLIKVTWRSLPFGGTLFSYIKGMCENGSVPQGSRQGSLGVNRTLRDGRTRAPGA